MHLVIRHLVYTASREVRKGSTAIRNSTESCWNDSYRVITMAPINGECATEKEIWILHNNGSCGEACATRREKRQRKHTMSDCDVLCGAIATASSYVRCDRDRQNLFDIVLRWPKVTAITHATDQLTGKSSRIQLLSSVIAWWHCWIRVCHGWLGSWSDSNDYSSRISPKWAKPMSKHWGSTVAFNDLCNHVMHYFLHFQYEVTAKSIVAQPRNVNSFAVQTTGNDNRVWKSQVVTRCIVCTILKRGMISIPEIYRCERHCFWKNREHRQWL